MNWIWGVEPKRDAGLLSRFRRRFLSVLGVLGTAFLLLVSLVMTAGGQAFASHVPGTGLLNQTFVGLVSFLAVTLLFAMIYKIVPDVTIVWNDVWIGAAVTALLYTIGTYLIDC